MYLWMHACKTLEIKQRRKTPGRFRLYLYILNFNDEGIHGGALVLNGGE